MGIFSRKPAGKAPLTKAGRVFDGIQDELDRNRRQRDEVAAKRAQKNQGNKK
jgi:hypothetical protein